MNASEVFGESKNRITLPWGVMEIQSSNLPTHTITIHLSPKDQVDSFDKGYSGFNDLSFIIDTSESTHTEDLTKIRSLMNEFLEDLMKLTIYEVAWLKREQVESRIYSQLFDNNFPPYVFGQMIPGEES